LHIGSVFVESASDDPLLFVGPSRSHRPRRARWAKHHALPQERPVVGWFEGESPLRDRLVGWSDDEAKTGSGSLATTVQVVSHVPMSA
jgi:hypothetical protein